jgi:enterochelin esterase-like enzyme
VGSSPVWVYLPPGYNAPGNDMRYPVVYLLHGFPGRSADWFAAGRVDATMNVLIGTGAMASAIVVAPDMNGGGIAIRDTEGLDLAHGPQIQTYLARTVPDWADSNFRTVRRPDRRVIGGMSAGGYAALNIGLRHQDVFGGVIAQEPYGEPGTSLLPALGGDRAAYAAESPSSYLPTMAFSRPEPTFIDDGAAEPGKDPRHLADLLRQRGQPVQFRLETGQHHTWTEARIGIAYGLVWLADQLHWSPHPDRTPALTPAPSTAAHHRAPHGLPAFSPLLTNA